MLIQSGIGILVVAAAGFIGEAAARDTFSRIAPSASSAEARHALIIGNANYIQGPLKNPLNDARAMANALSASGFNVLLLEDATQAGMQRAIRQFGDQIRKG